MGTFDYDVIIAGAGPAGSSAAIHLAQSGARVMLAEQKKFPRAKLCGEFISPECAGHFQRLGVGDRMFAAQPSSLTETIFYSKNGRSVHVPSNWFVGAGAALGLSRAEMDERLLRRAAETGVDVREDSQVVNVLFENQTVTGVRLRSNGTQETLAAPITIDATGRARVLARMAEKSRCAQTRSQRAPLVAFKAHLKNARVAPGACEIYFYPGGYGGLSTIENGFSNLCFIANARDARACHSNADQIMREIICQNRRASETLQDAVAQSEWLAVSLESFGRHSVTPANGLLAIGDAASFIDPFTGSGMLMALESGELVSRLIGDRLERLPDAGETQSLARDYQTLYNQKFNSRLRLCSMLRRAAFVPGLADAAIRFFRASDGLRRQVTRATRSRSKRNLSSAHSFK